MKSLRIKCLLRPSDVLDVRERFDGEVMIRSETPDGQPIVLSRAKARQLRNWITRWLRAKR